MFRKLRIALLLYVLLFVAVGQYLTRTGTTDWDRPLWVSVYLVNADANPATDEYLQSFDRETFREIETFFAEEAKRHGVPQSRPFRLELAGTIANDLPRVPQPGDWLGTLAWSLKMRWQVLKLSWDSDLPTPDITLFAVYHPTDAAVTLDRSTALRKGMIAIANVFASPRMSGSNRVVMAHELLHTLGATDKYDPATTLPLVPDGLAAPDRAPLFPQTHAELMAGRIALSPATAEIPESLTLAVIGNGTAAEIGW